jgi:hypothetical protein
MLGILRAIGAYVPEPGSLMWTVFMLIQRAFALVSGAQSHSMWFPVSGVEHPIVSRRSAAVGILGQVLGTKKD